MVLGLGAPGWRVATLQRAAALRGDAGLFTLRLPAACGITERSPVLVQINNRRVRARVTWRESDGGGDVVLHAATVSEFDGPTAAAFRDKVRQHLPVLGDDTVTVAPWPEPVAPAGTAPRRGMALRGLTG